MKLKTSTKSRFVLFTDSVTSLGVKLGIPAFIIAAGFLLYSALGPRIYDLAKMSQADQNYFIQTVMVMVTAAKVACVVIVATFVIRHFWEEVTGQALALVGALLYFGSPILFGNFANVTLLKGTAVPVFLSITSVFRLMGTVFLLPGLALVLRDAMLRIWTGISVKRVMERRWGDEEERRKKHIKPKIYGKCWDMAFCRDFVSRVCPAFKARKSCWRLRVGCYCDEKTILTAMTGFGGANNEYVRGIMNSLGLQEDRKKLMNARQKRARCRRCVIYAEHQRQKYRILSPIVAPIMLALFYAVRADISKYLGDALLQVDRFMRVLAYRPDGTPLTAVASDEKILVMLATISLWTIMVSYALRALEYLIFELQV